MLNALLLVLFLCIFGFVAVKLTIGLLLVAAMVVGATVRWIIVPIVLIIVGIIGGLVRGLAWTVKEVGMMPLRLLGMTLTPDARTRRTAARVAPAAMGVPCRNAACRCANPAMARFCRRCGMAVA